MKKKKVRHCQDCGVSSEKEYLSKNGLCGQCGYDRLFQVINQMHNKKGKYYERWEAAMRRRFVERERVIG